MKTKKKHKPVNRIAKALEEQQPYFEIVPSTEFADAYHVFKRGDGRPISLDYFGPDTKKNCETAIRMMKGEAKNLDYDPRPTFAKIGSTATVELLKTEDEPKNEYVPQQVQAPSRVYAFAAPLNAKLAKLLDSPKWQDVFKWAEAIRKERAVLGQYATVISLSLLIDMKEWPQERRDKAQRRLRKIYSTEFTVERQIGTVYSRKQEPQPEERGEEIGGFSIVKTDKPAKAPKSDEPKKPGVINTIIEVLKKANKKNLATKDSILKVLVATRPDKDPVAMSRTISSQIPSCLKTEKGLIVKTDGNGGWWLPKE